MTNFLKVLGDRESAGMQKIERNRDRDLHIHTKCTINMKTIEQIFFNEKSWVLLSYYIHRQRKLVALVSHFYQKQLNYSEKEYENEYTYSCMTKELHCTPETDNCKDYTSIKKLFKKSNYRHCMFSTLFCLL